MKKMLVAMVVAGAALLSGCAALEVVAQKADSVLGSTPEAQLVNATNTHTLAITSTTVLLSNNKIAVVQAQGFRELLTALRVQLDGLRSTLVACRKATNSTEKTNPDPCRASVADVLRLVVDGIVNVKRTLDAK